ELRVDPGLEPAEHLEDQLFVEDDRRVRLLGRDLARLPQLARGGVAAHRAELDRAVLALEVLGAAYQVDELTHLPRVAEHVVRPVGQELVRLVRPGVEADLHELQLEPRAPVAKEDTVDHRGARHGTRLRAEPALARDEVDQLSFIGHSASSFRNWNQKNPRGARVRRYGSSPMRGNRVRPNISSGTSPSQRDRSSSTACAERARLWTQRIVSSAYCRTCAKMRGFSGRSAS